MGKTLTITLMIALVFLISACSNETQTTQPVVSEDSEVIQYIKSLERVSVDEDDDPVKGSDTAKVTMVAFEDFQCGYCERFNLEMLPVIQEEYIDTGKVRLVFRDFPISSGHPMAQKAAEAAECADAQDKFWVYHDKLFANKKLLSIENFKLWADELGLDTEKFNTCLDNDVMRAEVLADFNYGQSMGVSGTPTIFINGLKIGGLAELATYKEIIDYELNK